MDVIQQVCLHNYQVCICSITVVLVYTWISFCTPQQIIPAVRKLRLICRSFSVLQANLDASPSINVLHYNTNWLSYRYIHVHVVCTLCYPIPQYRHYTHPSLLSTTGRCLRDFFWIWGPSTLASTRKVQASCPYRSLFCSTAEHCTPLLYSLMTASGRDEAGSQVTLTSSLPSQSTWKGCMPELAKMIVGF